MIRFGVSGKRYELMSDAERGIRMFIIKCYAGYDPIPDSLLSRDLEWTASYSAEGKISGIGFLVSGTPPKGEIHADVSVSKEGEVVVSHLTYTTHADRPNPIVRKFDYEKTEKHIASFIKEASIPLSNASLSSVRRDSI